MQIEITSKFRKQIKDCRDKQLRSKVLSIIDQVIAVDNMNGVNNLKKLTGYKNSYRNRMGNYRIGVLIDNNVVVFAAFDHRSDIYKYFP